MRLSSLKKKGVTSRPVLEIPPEMRGLEATALLHPPLPGPTRLPGSAVSDTTSAAITLEPTWGPKRQRWRNAENPGSTIDRRAASKGRGFSQGGD
ncbi:hypothetical protein NN561_019887 [Cricetulus griseus]